MMRKTLKLLGIITFTIFALTGCVFNSEVKVNKDGSADVMYMIAVTDEEMVELESSGYGKEEVIQPEGVDETTGIETKIYAQDGLQGNTYSKHVDNIADIDLAEFYTGSVVVTPYDNEDNTEVSPQFTVKEGLFVKKIILDANLDLSAANYQEYGVNQDYSFKLSTKGVITKTNATTKSGGTAEWKLKFDKYDVENKDSGNQLSATICFYNFFAIGLVAVVIIAIVCAGIVIVIKSRNKGNEKAVDSKEEKSENK